MTVESKESWNLVSFENVFAIVAPVLGIHGVLALLDPVSRRALVQSAVWPDAFYEVFTEEEQKDLIRFFIEYGGEGLDAGSEYDSSNE